MGILDKFKKKKEGLKQDLSEQVHPGAVFMMQLLMDELDLSTTG